VQKETTLLASWAATDVMPKNVFSEC